ncbi:MAG: hemerythrin domain-containing protein [Myxococcaceae bacterium]
MTDLIGTLKAQHHAVMELARQLDAHVTGGNVTEIQETLDLIKGALVAHLALEDKDLYPELVRRAEETKQDHLALVAKSFASNMERITEAVLRFLTKYENDVVDVQTFARDWHEVQDALVARIHAEETALYPLYGKTSREAEKSSGTPSGGASSGGPMKTRASS